MLRESLKRIFRERDLLDSFLILLFVVFSLLFFVLSIAYIFLDRPLASLLSFVIAIILLSSSLGIYRSIKYGS
ncbi:MAG: hypothetical protein ABWJ42_00475 [Sulfolobales archaeon]